MPPALYPVTEIARSTFHSKIGLLPSGNCHTWRSDLCTRICKAAVVTARDCPTVANHG
jgi:hypothetical protein